MVVPYPRIAINPPRTYEKLNCKGDTYRFSRQTDTEILLLLYKDLHKNYRASIVVILVEFPPTYDEEISFVWLNCGPILNYNILFLTIRKKNI